MLDRIRVAWPELVGETLAAHSVPLHLRDGVLRIGVDDPAWAGQFRYLVDGLVAELSERVPYAAIRDISVGGSRPDQGSGENRPPRRDVAPPRGPRNSTEPGSETPV